VKVKSEYERKTEGFSEAGFIQFVINNSIDGCRDTVIRKLEGIRPEKFNHPSVDLSTNLLKETIQSSYDCGFYDCKMAVLKMIQDIIRHETSDIKMSAEVMDVPKE